MPDEVPASENLIPPQVTRDTGQRMEELQEQINELKKRVALLEEIVANMNGDDAGYRLEQHGRVRRRPEYPPYEATERTWVNLRNQAFTS
jgi:hypothetical protein